MILRDGVTLALRAITAHRLRSFLTLLGIAVGIAAVILLTSIGSGIHRFVLAEFSQFGTHVIGIAPGRTEATGGPPGLPASVRPLSFEDAQALSHLPNVNGVVPAATGNAEVTANGRVRRTMIFGGNAAMLRVFNVRVRVGQFLPAEEGAEARNLVVLGPALKTQLFGTANALGARLRIGGLQFRVVGVLEPKGQFLGIDLDDTAYIPAARAMELFNREGLTEIHVSYNESAASARVAADVKKLLIARHGREDFTITTQEEMLRTLGNILDILTMAIGGLGSIEGAAIGALVVGLARATSVHLAPDFELFSIYLVMAGVLIFRPEGLFQSVKARLI